MCRDSSLRVSGIFFLLNLFLTTPPVSAPDVSKAEGLPLRDLRCLLPADPHVILEGTEEDGGELKMGQGAVWSFWLIKARATERCLDWECSSRSTWSPDSGTWKLEGGELRGGV